MPSAGARNPLSWRPRRGHGPPRELCPLRRRGPGTSPSWPRRPRGAGARHDTVALLARVPAGGGRARGGVRRATVPAGARPPAARSDGRPVGRVRGDRPLGRRRRRRGPRGRGVPSMEGLLPGAPGDAR